VRADIVYSHLDANVLAYHVQAHGAAHIVCTFLDTHWDVHDVASDERAHIVFSHLEADVLAHHVQAHVAAYVYGPNVDAHERAHVTADVLVHHVQSHVAVYVFHPHVGSHDDAHDVQAHDFNSDVDPVCRAHDLFADY
jgi:hypothetical protein